MAFCDGKNILITGASGLICSHVAEYFMKHTRAKIYALGRSAEKLHDVFSKYEGERLKYLVQDVSESIRIDEHIDYIFHGAGPIDGKTIKERPMDVILPNIYGLLNCCDLIRKQNKGDMSASRLVIFSSATVYENFSKNDCKFSEDDPLFTASLDAPNACYFESKRMAEVVGKAMKRQYEADIVIARFSYVYGNAYFKPDTAFYQFIDALNAHRPIVINNSGLARRDNLYIDDAVNAVMTIAEKGRSGEVYNISSGGDKGNYAAIDEMAQLLVDIYKAKGKTDAKLVFRQRQDGPRAPGFMLDNSKLKKLGWEVKTSLSRGIEESLALFLK